MLGVGAKRASGIHHNNMLASLFMYSFLSIATNLVEAMSFAKFHQ